MWNLTMESTESTQIGQDMKPHFIWPTKKEYVDEEWILLPQTVLNRIQAHSQLM
jgi:hypothetical protein